ncbi:unnamed protein product [Rotaria sp. Silwood1]|nr:unnamed protein product [Rotaria sp. Silwood1]
MPGSYFEVLGQLNPAPDLHIIQLKEITPPITLIKPPFFKSNEQKPSSVVHKSSTISPSTSVIMSPTNLISSISNEIPPIISGMNNILCRILVFSPLELFINKTILRKI